MILTAEEFLKNSNATGMAFNREAIQNVMKDFAKLHVEQSLKKASELVFYTTERDSFRNIKKVTINKESILNAYPPENIK